MKVRILSNLEHAAKSISGSRILVTGATGFIGSRVALRLAEYGSHVIGLCRTAAKGAALASKGIKLVEGDIRDSARLEALVSEDIDYVIHLAAWMRGSSAADAVQVNVDATSRFAEISARYGVKRFIYISSIAVYGMHGDRDVDEETALQLYNDPYGDSKIKAESALKDIGRKTGLSYSIVRPGMVYGPGSPGWTKRIARWAKNGTIPLIDQGRGTAYPVYIDNLIDMLIMCAVRKEAHQQIFNAVDDGPVTLGEFLGAYMQMIPTQRAIRAPGWLLSGIGIVANSFSRGLNLNYIASQMRGRGCVLNQKAKDLLGWEPRIGLAEGMRNSEAWLRAEGIL
jgi:2-alkyl-3-oxoalkanoate reductase